MAGGGEGGEGGGGRKKEGIQKERNLPGTDPRSEKPCEGLEIKEVNLRRSRAASLGQKGYVRSR